MTNISDEEKKKDIYIYPLSNLPRSPSSLSFAQKSFSASGESEEEPRGEVFALKRMQMKCFQENGKGNAGGVAPVFSRNLSQTFNSFTHSFIHLFISSFVPGPCTHPACLDPGRAQGRRTLKHKVQEFQNEKKPFPTSERLGRQNWVHHLRDKLYCSI